MCCRRLATQPTPPIEPFFGRGRQVAPIGGTDQTPLDCSIRRSLENVDNRADIREFLATRRAKLTPEQVAGGIRTSTTTLGDRSALLVEPDEPAEPLRQQGALGRRQGGRCLGQHGLEGHGISRTGNNRRSS